jgi:hypothetical protein
MIKELQYVNIRRVLDNLTDHPLLRDLTLEQVVRHTIRFIGLHGLPRMYQDKIVDIDIHEFRGLLPCDLISIIQVKDLRTGTCLRAMTDNFTPGLVPHSPHLHPHHKDLLNNVRDETKDCHHHHPKDMYIPPLRRHFEEMTFKTQGRVIFTSFPEGKVGVAYKAIPVDEDGYPLLLDNENYLAALEAYIKEKVFMVKFDTGKISAQVLQNAKQEYAFLAGELMEEFLIPSQSEMEALTRSFNTLIPRVREFDKGFKHLGDREWLRKH